MRQTKKRAGKPRNKTDGSIQDITEFPWKISERILVDEIVLDHSWLRKGQTFEQVNRIMQCSIENSDTIPGVPCIWVDDLKSESALKQSTSHYDPKQPRSAFMIYRNLVHGCFNGQQADISKAVEILWRNENLRVDNAAPSIDPQCSAHDQVRAIFQKRAMCPFDEASSSSESLCVIELTSPAPSFTSSTCVIQNLGEIGCPDVEPFSFEDLLHGSEWSDEETRIDVIESPLSDGNSTMSEIDSSGTNIYTLSTDFQSWMSLITGFNDLLPICETLEAPKNMELISLVHEERYHGTKNAQEDRGNLFHSTSPLIPPSTNTQLPRFISYQQSCSQYHGMMTDILQKGFQLPEDFWADDFKQVSTRVFVNAEQYNDIITILNRAIPDLSLQGWAKYQHPRLEELNGLLNSYLQYFHMQHPILHLPAILSQTGAEIGLRGRDTILIYAMCCAGGFVYPCREVQEYAIGMQELLHRALDCYTEEISLEYMQAWHLSNYVGVWSGNLRSIHSWSTFHSAIDSLRTKSQIFSQVDGWLFEIPDGEKMECWVSFQYLGALERLMLSQFELECQVGALTDIRPELTFPELSLSVSRDTDLWEAATSDNWASLWNSQLRTTQSERSRTLDLSATGIFRNFSRHYKDIQTASNFARGMRYEEFKLLLLGIFRFVLNIADNQTLLDSTCCESVALQRREAATMLEYWFASFNAFIPMKHVSLDIRFFYHLVAMTLYTPYREVRKGSERNCLRTLTTAITSVSTAWKTDGGRQARMGLWHAGQIMRLARISLISTFAAPWTLALMMEAVNVMWLYAAFHCCESGSQRSFSAENYFFVDEEFSPCLLTWNNKHGIPCIANSQGGIILVSEPEGLIEEWRLIVEGVCSCQRVSSNMEGQVIKELSLLVEPGNFKALVSMIRSQVDAMEARRECLH